MAEDSTTDNRDEELASLSAIFPELEQNAECSYSARLDIPIRPRTPLSIAFNPAVGADGILDLLSNTYSTDQDHDEKDRSTGPQELDVHQISHLPVLSLQIDLPDGYPDDVPPKVTLSAELSWLPDNIMDRLSSESEKLWQEYGHSQIIFAYIDFLQQEAENGFSIAKEMLPLKLPQKFKFPLLNYEKKRKQDIFEKATFDCGVCLEPKKGVVCYELPRCGHVFCIQCLQDFYTAAITEGEISTVKCLQPNCGTENMTVQERRGVKERTLHPRELLAIPIDPVLVKRYVDLKIKRKIETSKNVVFCPRIWCGAPARTAEHRKYLAITDVTEYPESDEEEANEEAAAQERLVICSSCSFAFCRICEASWHGDFVKCRPAGDSSLAEEEKASYDYIRANTSPCPSCDAAVQKTMGCNHMQCSMCNTHFCYLCSSWLEPTTVYAHWNTSGKPCYQLLWVLEGGDHGVGAQPNVFRGARAAEIADIRHERERAEEAVRRAARAERADREARAAARRERNRGRRNEIAEGLGFN